MSKLNRKVRLYAYGIPPRFFATQPCLRRNVNHFRREVEKPIKREGYVAKLIHVNFDCGQPCTFHSRVENNEKVSESLAQDVVNAVK